ncbi:MAG: hypothetical protein IKP09_04715 [Lentisphaeria bacterium]|nr:hypothetical protein [Lentisphaeria bacterium]
MCHGSALSKEVRKKNPVKTIGGTAEKSRGIGGKNRKKPLKRRGSVIENTAKAQEKYRRPRLFPHSKNTPLFPFYAGPAAPDWPRSLISFGIFLDNSLITALSG